MLKRAEKIKSLAPKTKKKGKHGGKHITNSARKNGEYWENVALKSSKLERGRETKRRQHKGGENEVELKQSMGKTTTVYQRPEQSTFSS